MDAARRAQGCWEVEVTWTKLSDDFSDDCWTLSDAAYRLHTEALVWSNRKLLNCRIPVDELRLFAKRPEAVHELLAEGWWETEGDCYVLVHHASYQRSREAVIAQQRANAQNGSKGGRPKGPPREVAKRPTPSFDANSESRSDSVGESRSERDRPVQARTTQPPTREGNESKSERQSDSKSDSVPVTDWPTAKIPNDGAGWTETEPGVFAEASS